MGAFLGISARTPTKYSLIGSLLAHCDQSLFARQFVVNFMGPVFYELTMMAAVPSEEDVLINQQMDSLQFATIIRFLCFVYLEAIQYEATEDMFEALTFNDQCQVAELQEHCAKSLKSLARPDRQLEWNRVQSWRAGGLGKRLCDYAVLFIGGRMPFYFDEAELTLLHSVVLETILDVAYSQRTEFDLAETGLMWLQRKLICGIPQNRKMKKRSTLRLTSESSVDYGEKVMATKGNIPNSLYLALYALTICSSVVNIFAVVAGNVIDAGEWQKFFHCSPIITLCSVVLWPWITGIQLMTMRLKLRPTLLLYLMNLDRDALESIIAARQRRIAIIHFEKGS